jgi:hypothetical protein
MLFNAFYFQRQISFRVAYPMPLGAFFLIPSVTLAVPPVDLRLSQAQGGPEATHNNEWHETITLHARLLTCLLCHKLSAMPKQGVALVSESQR